MQGQRQHDEQVSKIIEGCINLFYRLFSIVYAKSEIHRVTRVTQRLRTLPKGIFFPLHLFFPFFSLHRIL